MDVTVVPEGTDSPALVASGDVCLPYRVAAEGTEREPATDDVTAILIAFFVALVVAIIVVFIVVRFCCRRVFFPEYRDDEEKLVTEEHYDRESPSDRRPSDRRPSDQRSASLPDLSLLELPDAAKLKSGQLTSSTESWLYGGLADLVNESAQLQLSQQELGAIDHLTNQLKTASLYTRLILWRQVCSQLASSDKLTDEQSEQHSTRLQRRLATAVSHFRSNLQRDNKELMQAMKKQEQSDQEMAMQSLMQRAHTALDRTVEDVVEAERQSLMDCSKLTASQISKVMQFYHESFGQFVVAQKKISRRTEQALERRLAGRRLALGLLGCDRDETGRRQAARVRLMSGLLVKLRETTGDGKLGDQQLEAYRKKLHSALQRREKAARKAIGPRLKQLRLERRRQTAKLLDEQSREMREFYDNSLHDVNFVHSIHNQQLKQLSSFEKLQTLLDEDELEQLRQDAQVLRDGTEKALAELDSTFWARLCNKSDVAERGRSAFQRQIVELQESDDRQTELLVEQLRHLRQQRHDDERDERDERDKRGERGERDERGERGERGERDEAPSKDVVNRLIAAQENLSEKATDRLTSAIFFLDSSFANQRHLQKLQQSKMFEKILLAKKEEIMNNKVKKPKKSESSEHDRLDQMSDDELRLHRLAVARFSLRRKLQDAQTETERALWANETYGVCRLVAAEQLTQAQKQLKKELQHRLLEQLMVKLLKLLERLSEDDMEDASAAADRLSEAHLQKVEAVSDDLQRRKRRQLEELRDETKRKLQKKSRKAENQLRNPRGKRRHLGEESGFAAELLSQLAEEHGLQQTLDDVEHETALEAEKRKEEIRAETESELRRQIFELKRSYLVQMACLCRIRKEEIEELIDEVVAEAGVSEQESQVMREDVARELRKARTAVSRAEEATPKRRSSRLTEARRSSASKSRQRGGSVDSYVESERFNRSGSLRGDRVEDGRSSSRLGSAIRTKGRGDNRNSVSFGPNRVERAYDDDRDSDDRYGDFHDNRDKRNRIEQYGGDSYDDEASRDRHSRYDELEQSDRRRTSKPRLRSDRDVSPERQYSSRANYNRPSAGSSFRRKSGAAVDYERDRPGSSRLHRTADNFRPSSKHGHVLADVDDLRPSSRVGVSFENLPLHHTSPGAFHNRGYEY